MDRKIVLEEGVAALQRLFSVAHGDSGQCRYIAHFLLGLYNGMRFPFDLTDLRAIDGKLFDDCMLVLRMDARVTEQEVHRYFPDGGDRFEQLAALWNVTDVCKLKRAVETGVMTQIERVHDDLGDHVGVKVVIAGHAPGYRGVSVNLQLTPVDGEPVNVGASIDPASCLALYEVIREANAAAWRAGHRPLDARPDEVRPAWLSDA